MSAPKSAGKNIITGPAIDGVDSDAAIDVIGDVTADEDIIAAGTRDEFGVNVVDIDRKIELDGIGAIDDLHRHGLSGALLVVEQQAVGDAQLVTDDHEPATGVVNEVESGAATGGGRAQDATQLYRR